MNVPIAVDSTRAGHRLTIWFGACAMIGILIALYGPVMFDLAHDWTHDEGSSYGILVPPLAAYIAWARRRTTLSEPAVPANAGILLTLSGCLLFLTGKLGAEFFLARTSFVVVLTGLIWTFWGTRRLRTLSFPLILLITMVPLPTLIYNSLTMPLQLFASAASTQIIQAFGGSVYRDGNIIQLPNISLGVAEACSGLYSLMSLVVAALLVGYLFCSRVRTRLILFALAIPLAIAMNVLRITGTAVLGTVRQDLAMGFYHSFSGWLVFVAASVLLLGTARLLHKFID